MRHRRVVLVYKSLPEYRRGFFTLLRDSLDRHGVTLDLVHGHPTGSEKLERESVGIDGAVRRPHSPMQVGKRQLRRPARLV